MKRSLQLMVYSLRLSIILLMVAVSFTALAKGEDSLASKFDRANKYYQQQDYENAIKTYEDVIKENVISAGVYYNLGNAYYKTGNIAKSILNYERARRLAADDEDIDFNLKLANVKVVDKIEPIPMVFYRQWIHAAALAFGTDAWSKIFIGLVWFTVVLFALFILSYTPALKKLFFVSGIIFICISVFAFYISTVQDRLINHDEHAIVMTASSYVKSSPDEKGTDQFILHEGTKVEVMDEYNEWKKIRIANGSVGWIKEHDIELI